MAENSGDLGKFRRFREGASAAREGVSRVNEFSKTISRPIDARETLGATLTRIFGPFRNLIIILIVLIIVGSLIYGIYLVYTGGTAGYLGEQITANFPPEVIGFFKTIGDTLSGKTLTETSFDVKQAEVTRNVELNRPELSQKSAYKSGQAITVTAKGITNNLLKDSNAETYCELEDYEGKITKNGEDGKFVLHASTQNFKDEFLLKCVFEDGLKYEKSRVKGSENFNSYSGKIGLYYEASSESQVIFYLTNEQLKYELKEKILEGIKDPNLKGTTSVSQSLYNSPMELGIVSTEEQPIGPKDEEDEYEIQIKLRKSSLENGYMSNLKAVYLYVPDQIIIHSELSAEKCDLEKIDSTGGDYNYKVRDIFLKDQVNVDCKIIMTQYSLSEADCISFYKDTITIKCPVSYTPYIPEGIRMVNPITLTAKAEYVYNLQSAGFVAMVLPVEEQVYQCSSFNTLEKCKAESSYCKVVSNADGTFKECQAL